MIRIHPNVSRVATCALLVSVACGGCRSTSSGIGNPFLAPDRVAPPSTRAIAPGQAQPYYQGDPLPVMQSEAAPAANSLMAGDSAAARSSTGKTLAWNTPGSAAPATISPPSAINNTIPWGTNPQPPMAYANEPAVSVPTDADALRFALPTAISPEPITPIAAAPTPAPAAPTNPGVQLASYNAPVATGPSPIIGVPPIGSQEQINSPWRTPQVMQATPSPPYGTQTSPLLPLVASQPYAPPTMPMSQATQSQIAYPTNPMAVQLRAVASPPPTPGDPMPRIRIPGYEVPQTATADGFRPRSSMR